MRAHKVSITQFDEMKVIGFLHAFYPLADLALGINHQRPPPGIPTNKHTRIKCLGQVGAKDLNVLNARHHGGGARIDAEQLRREASCLAQ